MDVCARLNECDWSRCDDIVLLYFGNHRIDMSQLSRRFFQGKPLLAQSTDRKQRYPYRAIRLASPRNSDSRRLLICQVSNLRLIPRHDITQFI
jgi:hypothetical protein